MNILGEEWGYEGWESSQPDNKNDPEGNGIALWWNPTYKIDAAWKWNDIPLQAKHSFICKSYI